MSVQRTRNIYDPSSEQPFKLSRSKLELFLTCPRCFYLDRRLGISQPSMPAFTLNSAVDTLLKREFDTYRIRQQRHPLTILHGIEVLPFQHPLLDDWRDNRKGVQVHDEGTNFLVFGSVDDLWINTQGEIHVVDYKSTSTEGDVSLEGQWKEAYKRQVSIYQWLLRGNGLPVSNIAYFVYANGDKKQPSFQATLKFKMSILPYEADATWVADALHDASLCLRRNTPPMARKDCEWCLYRSASHAVEHTSQKIAE